jgi:dTDP-4-dehydrorhamnose reductase
VKILLFGGSGQLGTDLRFALAGHELFFPSRGECPIEDAASVRRMIALARPHLIINAAAFTHVDAAEETPELAFTVNALAVRNLALACREAQIPLVHFSTDYVFDGRKGVPYSEDDLPNPLNVYGVSKLAGEYFVRNIATDWLLIRTSALFGPGKGEHPARNFVESILQQAKVRPKLRVVSDQITAPTFTYDLAQKTVELLRANARGIFHVTNQGTCSFFELAQAIVRGADAKVEIQAISSAELNRPASRPAYSVLENRRLQREGYSLLRPWEEALEEYLGRFHHATQERK